MSGCISSSFISIYVSACTGFPRLLESPGFFVYNFQALESSRKWVWSGKVLEILVLVS